MEQLIQRRINQLRLTQDMPNSNTHTHSHIYSICFFGTFYLKIEMFECVRYMVQVSITVSRLQTSDSGMNPNEPNQILQHLPVAVLNFSTWRRMFRWPRHKMAQTGNRITVIEPKMAVCSGKMLMNQRLQG